MQGTQTASSLVRKQSSKYGTLILFRFPQFNVQFSVFSVLTKFFSSGTGYRQQRPFYPSFPDCSLITSAKLTVTSGRDRPVEVSSRAAVQPLIVLLFSCLYQIYVIFRISSHTSLTWNSYFVLVMTVKLHLLLLFTMSHICYRHNDPSTYSWPQKPSRTRSKSLLSHGELCQRVNCRQWKCSDEYHRF